MSISVKRTIKIFCLALAVVGYAILLWRGPWLLDAEHIRSRNLQPADGVVITGVRTALVALGAGAVAGIGLFYTHRNHKLSQDQFNTSQEQFSKQHEQNIEQFTLAQKQFEHSQEQFRETRRKDREQTQIAREGQVTGRYVEAIKLLSSKSLTERLGGIYSLERIMHDSTRDYTTIIEVLAAFIRTAASPHIQEWIDLDTKGTSRVPVPSLAEDIQAAITVLGRRPDYENDAVVNLAISEVISDRIFGVSLQRVSLRNANLQGAQLQNATLVSADLTEAKLAKANMSQTRLRFAQLKSADLQEVDLSSANLEKSILVSADLRGADFSGAKLDGAYLAGADLSGTDFFFADLDSTDFINIPKHAKELREIHSQPPAKVKGLTIGQLEHAFIYRSTKLPEHFSNHPLIQEIIEECEKRRGEARELRAKLDLD
ncbi:pentapeptide repeat-containing protein [Streptomyces violaceus]|uniref:Pentapeptide repeat-containing protein n=1 Tax=Streptomyces violaceus TaxID=1936 RepID=A0ABY9UDC8_STRVL|nr:pentapeptide repeat-containing protein [Streptomyces janthinus]WND19800.1 pentapeptide repeat-containing protein [Streptomyces janthinus]